MGIGFQTIINRMDSGDIIKCYVKNHSDLVQSVKYFTNNQEVFQPDALYIGMLSDLPRNVFDNEEANIICLKDTELNESALQNCKNNFVLLSSACDLRKIQIEIQSLILENRSAAFNLEKKLMDLLCCESGLQKIADIGYEVLGNPVTISDINTNTLAVSRNISVKDDPMWNEVVNKGVISHETIYYYLHEKKEFGEKFESSSFPFFWKDYVSDYTRIIGKVTVNNKNVAMVVTADYEKPLQPSDLELVSILCKAVSIEMQKNKTQYNIGWMDYEIFLRDLLEGKYKGNYAVNETARQLGMEFKRYKFVMTVDISTFDHSHHSLPYMKNILEKLANGKAVVLDDKIILIFSTDKEDITPDTNWNSTVVFLKDNNLCCGLSRPFLDLSEAQEHYIQSAKALQLGMLMKTSSTVSNYEDLVLYHVMEICSRHKNLRNFCHPVLFKLMEYDTKHNTSFLRSLYVFLHYAPDLSSAAKALHIHRNSLKYRIEKIQKIINRDLNDRSLQLNLHFSFRILDYLDDKEYRKCINQNK